MDINALLASKQVSGYELNQLLLADVVLDGVDFSVSQLTDCSFSKTTFRECNFSQVIAQTLKMDDCKFIDCNFSFSQLIKVDFNSVEFHGCNLSTAVMQGLKGTGLVLQEGSSESLNVIESEISGLKVMSSNLVQSVWQNCSLQLSSWVESNFGGADFQECDLTGVVIENSIAPAITFTDCKVDNFKVSDSDLANFRSYNIKPVKNISFERVGFDSSNFANNCLEGASFIDCDLSACNFTEASLLNVTIKGSNTQNSTWLNGSVENCDFSRNEMRQNIWAGCRLKSVNFQRSDLFESDFQHSTVVECDITFAHTVNTLFEEWQP
jgi:uncharacterized protein YjbI with pentapeptide repeats